MSDYNLFEISDHSNDSYSFDIKSGISNEQQQRPSPHTSGRSQKYRPAWERMQEFRKWLKPVLDNPYKAACIACKKTIVSEVMVLRKHCISNKHVKQMAKLRQDELWERMNRSGALYSSEEDDDFVSHEDRRGDEKKKLKAGNCSKLAHPLPRGEPDNNRYGALKRKLDQTKSVNNNYNNAGDNDNGGNYDDDSDTDDSSDDSFCDESVDSFDEEEQDSDDGFEDGKFAILDDKMKKKKKKQLSRFPPICVGDPAPFWKCCAVENGEVVNLKLTDYKGRFLVMFFYNENFSSLCSNEVTAISNRIELFKQFNTDVVACSVDSFFSHIAWTGLSAGNNGISDLKIPLLSDVSHNISKMYGCYEPIDGFAQRAVFIIDPNGILRYMGINDTNVGRSAEEILRLVSTLHYKHKNRSSK